MEILTGGKSFFEMPWEIQLIRTKYLTYDNEQW